MPRTAVAKWQLLSGAILCIPGVLALAVFVTTANTAADLQSAPSCASPTRDAGSNCLSTIRGQIRNVGTHGQLTIAFEDTSVSVSYDCGASPSGACGFGGYPGAPIETGWWRGKMVLVGAPANGLPAALTDDNPYHQLMYWMFVLFAVIPGVALVLAGVLTAQAPRTLNEFVKDVLARSPDPPREVDQAMTRRVAWGYSSNYTWFVWGACYFFACFGMLLSIQWRWAVPALFISFVVSYGVTLVVTPIRLYRDVSRCEHRTVVVERFEGLKSGVRVWYRRTEGNEGRADLDGTWTGHVQVGDAIDALIDPRSGGIRRVLSAPPARA
jgi:hypothetical protein